MSGGVFICYRREDSAGFAGRIYDRLKSGLGRESVFIDVDNIPAGRDFVEVLTERVGRCDALVALIGKNWLASADKDGRRRLDDPNDFVRIEIEAALERNVPVIPVLVDGAAMPQATDLPETLKKLARRQGIEISHNRFDSDADRLTEALVRIDGAAPAQSSPPPNVGAALPMAVNSAANARWPLLAVAALLVIAGGAGFFYEYRGAHESETTAIPGSDTDVESTIAAPQLARLQTNVLCVRPTAAFDSSTRDGIRVFQAAFGVRATGTVSSAADLARMVKSDRGVACPPGARNWWEAQSFFSHGAEIPEKVNELQDLLGVGDTQRSGTLDGATRRD
jgi:hypothetical protein